MATFNGTAGNDIANAALGQLAGFTGGSLAQLQDLTGDLIFGFEGDDYIFAGNGNDQIEGWDGRDIINGGAGNDQIWANQISDVEGSPIGDEITGNDGDDTILGSAGGDSVDGSAGGDVIFGGGGDDLLQGGSGFDRIFGGGGGDTIYGSDLAATAEAANVFNGLWGEDGNDAIVGADRKDSITGGAGADALQGGGGGDEFYYYAGDLAAGETIDGGAGPDALLLAPGAALYDFRLAASIASIEAVLIGFNAQPTDTIGAMFLAAQIKNLPADLALVSGAQTSVLQVEMAGETMLDMSAFNLFSNWNAEDRVEVFGDADGETVVGTSGVDVLFGAGGNDRLDGGAGDDRMTGGAGADIYVAGTPGDIVIEAAVPGEDTIETTLANYSLFTLASVERLTFIGSGNFVGRGNGLDNRIEGGLGNDRFVADRGGADRFFGGLGSSDRMDFRTSTVGAIVNLATGVHGGAAAGDVFSSIEFFYGSSTAADNFTGAGAAVRFDGYGGNDTLSGRGGKDTLNGGDGNDEIAGGAARDILSGGAGADDFNYASVSDSGPSAAIRDRIAGFTHDADDIDVSAIDARAGSAGNNAFGFIGAAAFTAEGQVRWFQSGADTVIEFNTAGIGGAEMQIQLDGFTAATLTAADFIA